MRTDRTRWALAACALLTGCYASNVVARTDRAVRTDVTGIEWHAVTAADTPGLWESVAVEGEAATQFRRIWYWFGGDGRYAAAALVEGDAGPDFQTKAGRWQCAPDGLQLDGATPVPCDAGKDHLRLRSERGVVVLQRASGW